MIDGVVQYVAPKECSSPNIIIIFYMTFWGKRGKLCSSVSPLTGLSMGWVKPIKLFYLTHYFRIWVEKSNMLDQLTYNLLIQTLNGWVMGWTYYPTHLPTNLLE